MNREFFESVLKGLKGECPASRNRDFELFSDAERRKVHGLCRLVKALEEEALSAYGPIEISVEKQGSSEGDGFVIQHRIPDLRYLRRTLLPKEAAHHFMEFLSRRGVPFRKPG